MPEQENIAEMPVEFSNGNRATANDLLPPVYAELKDMAANYLRRDHTLQPTALVHEA